jgi:hypothetical protein
VFAWRNGTGGANELARLTSTGLGIGTSSPGSRLHVNAANSLNEGAAAAVIRQGGSAGNNGLVVDVTNTPDQYIADFRIGNASRMRLDSSGNLGLGVTPSAWSLTDLVAFQFKNGSLFGYQTTESGFQQNAYFNSGWKYISSGILASQYIQAAGQHKWYTAPSGTAGDAISFTQAMTLDASGNLRLGTTGSSDARLYVRGAGTTSATASFEAANSSGVTRLFVQDDGTTRFFGSSGSESARIESNGDFMVGTTGQEGAVTFKFNRQDQDLLKVRNTSTTSAYGLNVEFDATVANIAAAIRVFASGNLVFNVAGSGNVTNTNNSYGAISDVKMKENVTDATPKLDKLNQVRVVNYNLIGEEQKQIGVIAQELEQVFPGMVEETKDRDMTAGLDHLDIV